MTLKPLYQNFKLSKPKKEELERRRRVKIISISIIIIECILGISAIIYFSGSP